MRVSKFFTSMILASVIINQAYASTDCLEIEDKPRRFQELPALIMNTQSQADCSEKYTKTSKIDHILMLADIERKFLVERNVVDRNGNPATMFLNGLKFGEVKNPEQIDLEFTRDQKSHQPWNTYPQNFTKIYLVMNSTDPMNAIKIMCKLPLEQKVNYNNIHGRYYVEAKEVVAPISTGHYGREIKWQFNIHGNQHSALEMIPFRTTIKHGDVLYVSWLTIELRNYYLSYDCESGQMRWLSSKLFNKEALDSEI